MHLALRHADLCVRVLLSNLPVPSVSDSGATIRLGTIGLHVKALLLRRRSRKQKKLDLHSYQQALFDAHMAAGEGHGTSVRLIWQADKERDDQGPKQFGTAT